MDKKRTYKHFKHVPIWKCVIRKVIGLIACALAFLATTFAAEILVRAFEPELQASADALRAFVIG